MTVSMGLSALFYLGFATLYLMDLGGLLGA